MVVEFIRGCGEWGFFFSAYIREADSVSRSQIVGGEGRRGEDELARSNEADRQPPSSPFRFLTFFFQGHLLPLDLLGEDGENLVSLAIMGSAAREEKEECVRMLVRRRGVEGSDSGQLSSARSFLLAGAYTSSRRRRRRNTRADLTFLGSFAHPFLV